MWGKSLSPSRSSEALTHLLGHVVLTSFPASRGIRRSWSTTSRRQHQFQRRLPTVQHDHHIAARPSQQRRKHRRGVRRAVGAEDSFVHHPPVIFIPVRRDISRRIWLREELSALTVNKPSFNSTCARLACWGAGCWAWTGTVGEAGAARGTALVGGVAGSLCPIPMELTQIVPARRPTRIEVRSLMLKF